MNAAVKKVTPTTQLALPLIRQFIKELNHIECKHTPNAAGAGADLTLTHPAITIGRKISYKDLCKRYSWKQSNVYDYVMKEQTSESNMAALSYYVTLLKAIRCNKELQEKYKGVGERSIEETARIVGLKMPKLYQDPND